MLDLVCLALLMLAAVAGALSGAVRQLVQLAVVAAAVVGSSWFSGRLVEPLKGWLPELAARPIGVAVTFVLILVLLGLVARIALGAAEGAGALRGPLDRAGGAVLGGAKAALVVWLALSALTLWGGPERAGNLRRHVERSDFAAFAREVNLVEQVRERDGKTGEAVAAPAEASGAKAAPRR